MADCARPNCTQPAHPLDAYCSRLCHEVHIGRQPETAIEEHAKWLRNHRAGGNPQRHDRRESQHRERPSSGRSHMGQRMSPVQHELFDPSTTGPTPCPVPGCGAIRLAGQERVVTCDIDRARASEYVSRPLGCLNYPKPQHEPIPF